MQNSDPVQQERMASVGCSVETVSVLSRKHGCLFLTFPSYQHFCVETELSPHTVINKEIASGFESGFLSTENDRWQ